MARPPAPARSAQAGKVGAKRDHLGRQGDRTHREIIKSSLGKGLSAALICIGSKVYEWLISKLMALPGAKEAPEGTEPLFLSQQKPPFSLPGLKISPRQSSMLPHLLHHNSQTFDNSTNNDFNQGFPGFFFQGNSCSFLIEGSLIEKTPAYGLAQPSQLFVFGAFFALAALSRRSPPAVRLSLSQPVCPESGQNHPLGDLGQVV